jgi:NAD(P)-dependent dehydrogenase (short-subunit alcohol dehydrogenase family)
MPESDWDDVLDVNLKGTFQIMRFAVAYWRDRRAAGDPIAASVVNTASRGGLFARSTELQNGGSGVANYATSKGAIATLSEAAAVELAELGIRVNCICPSARTRLTLTPRLADAVAAPTDGSFDEWEPLNISPLVAWLSTAECELTGKNYWIKGGRITVLRSWTLDGYVEHAGRWTVAEIDAELGRLSVGADDEARLAL